MLRWSATFLAFCVRIDSQFEQVWGPVLPVSGLPLRIGIDIDVALIGLSKQSPSWIVHVLHDIAVSSS